MLAVEGIGTSSEVRGGLGNRNVCWREAFFPFFILKAKREQKEKKLGGDKKK